MLSVLATGCEWMCTRACLHDCYLRLWCAFADEESEACRLVVASDLCLWVATVVGVSRNWAWLMNVDTCAFRVYEDECM